jgi:Tfp pilus assembly protein PilE
MGQQQILLIILGVIVVGIAVTVGINMFQDNAINSNRDGVSNDLISFAARAQQFYRRPRGLAGGENSFTGLTATDAGMLRLTQNPVTANGTYSIKSASAQSITLLGVGRYTIGEDSIRVECVVTPHEYTLTIIK